MVRYMYLDAAAIFVLLIIMIANIARKMYFEKTSKIFLGIIIVCILAAIFDIISVYPKTIGITGLWISTTGYFIFRNLTSFVYILYIMSLTDSDREARTKRKFYMLLAIPYAIVFILIAINPILPNSFCVFRFELVDGVYKYIRGNAIYALYGISVIYIIVGIVWVIKYRKYFTIAETISVSAIFPITLITLAIQSYNNKYLVELFGSALALLLAQIIIERQEILVDKKTGLSSKKVFIDVTRKNFDHNRNKSIALINLANYNELYNLLTFDEADKYLIDFSKQIDTQYRDINQAYKSFYFGSGLFSLVVDNEKTTLEIAEKLLHNVANRSTYIGFNPNISICIIDLLTDFDKYDDLLLFTSNYRSKITFHDNITLIRNIKNDKNFIIMNNIDSIIDTAIKNHEFEVFYQPIINMKEKKFKSAEALVRLISEEYGFISPGAFIPYAEKNGMISTIDSIVMEKVFQFISSPIFKDLGLDYIEINLSMVDCMDATLSYRIISLMKKYNIDPSKINLEITESYDSLENVNSKTNIKKLEEYGIKFSLDDYGTGYSNIDRFTKFPIKIVKIDKSLVDSSNEDNMKMVLKTTFKLIQELHRETVVEGVETEEQAKLFEEFGCDFIQGYYFSKPLPLTSFVEFINKQKETKIDDGKNL